MVTARLNGRAVAQLDETANNDELIETILEDVASDTRVKLDATFAPQSRVVVAAAQNGVAAGNTAAANTTALNNLHISAAALGATIVLPPGTINVNALTFKASMRGAGKGETILETSASHLVAAGNIELADLTFRASIALILNFANQDDITLRSVAFDWTAGVVTDWLAANFYQTARVRVLNCNFRIGGIAFSGCNDLLVDGNYWDCEYLNTNEPCHISRQSSGQFVNNTIYRTLTDGLDLYSSGEYCVVANNRFIGLKGASGIEVKVTMSDDPNNTSGPGNVIDGVVITGNVLRDFISVTTSTRAGIYAEYVDSRSAPAFAVAETNRGIIITGNVLQDFNAADPGGGIIGNWWGIAFTGLNGVIADNTIRNARTWNTSGNVGIKLAAPTASKCVGVRVAGNVIAGIEGTAGAGIEAGNLDRCQIDGNIVRGDEVNATQTKFGVNIVAAATLNHCSISGNTFECNNAAGFGVRTAASTVTLNRCRVQNNTFKDCGIQVHVAQYTLFSGNSVDDATNSQAFVVGVSGTSCRGNVYSGNHITMSSDYGFVLTDHDGVVVTGNTFNATNRAVLMVGGSRNGVFDNNVSIVQSGGVEFPHYSGVSAPDQATNTVGANKVLAT